jgi:diphthamide biosynthesis methyltransferase
MVVTHVGLALAAPAEFVVARIIHGASGVSVQAGSATA